MSKTTTIVRMGADGRLFRVRPTGDDKEPNSGFAEERAPYEDGVDLDNPPLSPDQLRRMKRVPRVRTLRRALALTQEEFAERYRIPVGTLRDWEQGRSEPDAPARAYLKVIASDPEGIVRLLGSGKSLGR
jgi:putative transcriptional regulator